MLLGLDAKPASVNEVERQLGLNEDVLRFMTIRVDELEEAPPPFSPARATTASAPSAGPSPPAASNPAARAAATTTARNSAPVTSTPLIEE
jgi:hypothetical protein